MRNSERENGVKEQERTRDHEAEGADVESACYVDCTIWLDNRIQLLKVSV